MTDHASSPGDPDLAQGIPLADLPDGGMVTGHVGDAPVLVVRRAGTCFAVGATCTHYGAPLADGLVVDDTIRCPWHHACFSLRTGEALRAPALSGLTCWRVEQHDGKVFVRDALPAAAPPVSPAASHPASVVIVGGGAAGNAAAQTLRQQGYQGPVTLLSADPALPYDRPNLSKDYLAGTAQADWLPLHAPEFYAERQIDVRCGARAVKLDPRQKIVTLADGGQLAYDALLLATGADPIRLAAPGATLPHVAVLRTLADCDALIARAGSARRCVVVGASFIGLEVAAIDADRVTLSTGASLAAELVVTGIGVRPDIALAQDAGLAIDRGVTVDAFLQTSAPGIYAAGDIARWPDPRTGERIRVEHWVVAERQGAAAALNILGQRQPFAAVPFFWSQHYDVAINYVGHAEHWDRIDVDGDPAAHDCTVTYWRDGKPLAVATVGRDRASLDAEAAFERQTPA
ncbi:FAD-dependent oxidoreductase [Burkholderia stagnalis]|uniref:FAD-dependent oxidoreductase n=1 Tax=Burkholderia stagnalis TaxID=1503054 RepID=UPI00075D49FE|nr:FAD-dependent oxidoreductase [Burkholderia stagnalis]KVN04287.1 pyridine nucleotide-disulfide oxidoreductase [Burkholderia stagnalis]KWE05187.1 pyridine nucleotide-disulfide oxidoreductase [Burkholderia stagnalis]KWE21314.1 pyridine nucleotide-disulfide oxidoreductase [Burkholderia stagnalis]KWO76256.1 pyridine nucleotide-disulfide oxidoreductase [Burkholderia stagnalis]